MAKIYKYELHVGETDLEIPQYSKPLTVQMQNGKPYVWILHNDLEARKIKMKFHVIGTGHEFNSSSKDYLGTFQVYEGALIFHVFY